MKPEISHPIRYVALHTGLKPYLIRTWEERYSAVCPRRSASNRRLYSDADVRRLKLLKEAVDCGHNISAVASLSDRDLARIAEHADTNRYAAASPKAVGPILPPEIPQHAQQTVDKALECVRQLDALNLENVLSESAVELPRQSFLQLVVVPLFARIGELWRAGVLKTINEHMASVVVRSMLWDMLRTVEIAETAPRIVVATPVGHWHEFGALASALASSESGWKPLYFGPNLPADEIAYAVRKLEAKALSLSLCHQINDSRLVTEINKIRRATEARVQIFLGGYGAVAAERLLKGLHVIIVNDLSKFRGYLEKIVGQDPS